MWKMSLHILEKMSRFLRMPAPLWSVRVLPARDPGRGTLCAATTPSVACFPAPPLSAVTPLFFSTDRPGLGCSGLMGHCVEARTDQWWEEMRWRKGCEDGGIADCRWGRLRRRYGRRAPAPDGVKVNRIFARNGLGMRSRGPFHHGGCWT